MDFTLKKYRELLLALQGYGEVTLRHDVDKKPQNSVKTARIEQELGWKAVYYFRAKPYGWEEEAIREITAMGHEIGYHYESLSTCDGDMELAYRDFCDHLESLRKLVPVTSICMHGSPTSQWDSRDLWKYYDYHQLGIKTESYLDTDFSEVFYLTDTGRCWDGFKVSVRDKIPEYQEQWSQKGWVYHHTDDVIKAVKEGHFPQKAMVTTHPQRWTDNPWQWCCEMGVQWVKNMVKAIIVKKKL
jgi:hypothetical protein